MRTKIDLLLAAFLILAMVGCAHSPGRPHADRKLSVTDESSDANGVDSAAQAGIEKHRWWGKRWGDQSYAASMTDEDIEAVLTMALRFETTDVRAGVLVLELLAARPADTWRIAESVPAKQTSITTFAIRLKHEGYVQEVIQEPARRFLSDVGLLEIARADRDLTLRDDYGLTAMDWALAYGDFEMVALLQMAGAPGPTDWSLVNQVVARLAILDNDTDKLARVMAIGVDLDRDFARWDQTVRQLGEASESADINRMVAKTQAE